MTSNVKGQRREILASSVPHLLAGKGVTTTGRRPETKAVHRSLRRPRAAGVDTVVKGRREASA